MASVTVPGTSGSSVNELFSNANNSLLAQQISDAIAAVTTSGGGNHPVNVELAGIGGNIPDFPTTVGAINELIITQGGTYDLTARAAGQPALVVVVNTPQDVRIIGQANTTVWGGGGNVTVTDGASIALAEGGTGTATLQGAGAVVAGNNSNDTLSASGAHDTIFAGTGTNVLSASGASDVIVGNAGTNTFNVSGSSDTVMAGVGTAAVNASGVAAQIFGGSGAMTVATSGSADSVFAGTGNTTILGGDTNGTYFMGPAGVQEFVNMGGTGTVFAGAGSPSVFGSFGETSGSDEVFGGSGALLLATGGSNDTVFAGSGPSTIFGAFGGSAVGNNVIFGGSGPLEVVTGLSSDTVFAGTGADTVFIGTGTAAGDQLINGGMGALRVQFVGGAGSATVIGGSGAATVFGTGDSNAKWIGMQTGGILDAVGNVTSTGSYDASASTTNDTLIGASGNVSMTGGSGNDFLMGGVNTGSIGGAGSVVGGTTMSGGAGSNVFLFTSGLVNGGDIVQDFGGTDFLALSGYGVAEADKALGKAATVGGTTTLTLSDGTSISFVNTPIAQLQGHISST